MPRFDYKAEIEKLLKTHPDPRLGADGKIAFREKQIRKMAYPVFGVVVDNKDPLCLGRIRVHCNALGPNAVTPWIPIIGMGKTKNAGFWQLPDIGVQAFMCFVRNCRSQPVVLGFLYDLKHRPPEHSTENRADSIVYQTKKHRMEIIDEAGKESIIISTAKGKMRLVIAKDKGIQIINELGDINIKCRKLLIEGETVDIAAKKALSLTTEDAFTMKATKGIKIGCDKEITFTGKNIKLDASKGIATEGKQLAAEGDKVMGFDVHNMEMPSPTGTVVVPLPHPFIGKLNDALSEDVKINGHNAALKGSLAKHDCPMHMQLPGTIKFVNNPEKEGEVTGGTGAKVKINGEEVAVIGSMVTTCNDIGLQNNSTVIAVGASIPMPVIINPKNTEEYTLEREEKDKLEPEFKTVKWVKASVKEGEELELSAQVKDITDGNMVTLQVWKEGQDPAGAGIPYAQLPAAIEGGVATATWMYTYEGLDIPPAADPKFFFSAHSAWCPMKKSSNATIELVRPELSGIEWKNEEGSTVDKISMRQRLRLSVQCKDMKEGDTVTFSVFQVGANIEKDTPMTTVMCINEGGVATTDAFDCPCTGGCNESGEDKKCFCTVQADRCESIESNDITVEPAEFTEPKWKDVEGNEITDRIGIVGEALKLSVRCGLILEGSHVWFKIFYEGADPETDKPIAVLRTEHNNGMAEVVWNYESNIFFNPYIEDDGEEAVKLIFTCEEHDSKTVQSDSIKLSYADCWELLDDGKLIHCGAGWLKDSDGNDIENAKGDKLGAGGRETGLLNILFERNYTGKGKAHGSEGTYGSFKGTEQAMTQEIMRESGMKPSNPEISDPLKFNKKFLWFGNEGATLNMDSVMEKAGVTVATQVFIRYYLKEANDFTVYGEESIQHFHPNLRDRLRSYGEALKNFYDSGEEQVEEFNAKFPNPSLEYGYVKGYLGSGNFHKGYDHPLEEGTELVSQYSGKIVELDRGNNTSSGNDVRIELGFEFEGSFISTGILYNTFHMQSVATGLIIGNFYESGTVIGKSGNTTGGDTDASSGPHLHTEMRVLFDEKIFEDRNIVRTNNTLFTNSFVMKQLNAPSLNLFETLDTEWKNYQNFYFDNRQEKTGWHAYYVNLNHLYGNV